MRLAIVASHPVQYYAPLFRELGLRLDLTVFYAHRATPEDQAKAGFGVGFDWDVDLLSGYSHIFLHNIAMSPSLDRFNGCDAPEIGRRLADGRFDAVLTLGWHTKVYLQAIVAAKRLGLKLLVRGDSQLVTRRSVCKRVAKSVAYPPFLRVFDAALYVGERSRAYWQRYKYPAARLFFSPHCVDTEWFASRATPAARNAIRKRFEIPSDLKIVLFAGKLVPRKRPLDLLAAAVSLQSQGCPIGLLIAGAGPLEEEMSSAAHTLAVPFYQLGFCNQTEMPSAYAASDVLVLPSDNDTWGLVANEALACGRPVVLSEAVGAAPDLTSDGAAGRTFAVGDIHRLAEALREVLTNPPSIAAIAKKSAAYSLEAGAKGIVQAVSSVCI